MQGGLKRVGSADRLAQAGGGACPPAAATAARQQRRLALRFRGCRLGLPVPSEMWGAAALAVRMAQPSAVPPQLHRAASAVIAQAFSAVAASLPAEPVSEDHPKALASALDWRPRLSGAEEAASLLLPAAVCAGVYAATAPPAVQPLYGAAMALLYAALVAGARLLLVERGYRAVQRSERELAGAEGRFFPMGGAALHYKRRTPLGLPPGLPRPPGAAQGPGRGPAAAVHCLHGFGASSYSWSFVQQQLADGLRAVVTAHDMPGFGLSERPRASSFYTLHFNGEAAQRILDAELTAAGHNVQSAAPPAPPTPAQSTEGRPGEGLGEREGGAGAGAQPQRPKRILIGHSMGGAAAAESVIGAPDGVDALVLVAPAIVALWLGPPQEAAGDPVARGLAVVEELVGSEDEPGELQRWPSSSSSSNTPLLSRSDSTGSSDGGSAAAMRGSRHGRVRRAVRAAAVVAKAALLLAVRLALLAAAPLLVLVMRRLVRSRRFWERGLMSAWYDGGRVTREYVDVYRSGQLVRGWEGGILRFLAARFDEKAGFWGAVREAVRGEGHLTQAERLAAVVRRTGLPVLIVHGAADALVPAANSRRLATLLPGAQLAVFEKCGHMPQEECAERFVATVRRFVDGLG